MKVEEVELKSCLTFSNYTYKHCTPQQIINKEREMVQSFNWKINPDTLFFWLQAYVNHWDEFISNQSTFFDDLVIRFKFNDYQPEVILNSLTHPFVCFAQ